MTHDSAKADRLRERFAAVDRALAELKAEVYGAERPPVNGEVRGGNVWVWDRWCYLPPRVRELFAYCIGAGIGKSLETIAESMGWDESDTKYTDKQIRAMNAKFKKTLKHPSKCPYFHLSGGVLVVDWHGAEAKKTA